MPDLTSVEPGLTTSAAHEVTRCASWKRIESLHHRWESVRERERIRETFMFAFRLQAFMFVHEPSRLAIYWRTCSCVCTGLASLGISGVYRVFACVHSAYMHCLPSALHPAPFVHLPSALHVPPTSCEPTAKPKVDLTGRGSTRRSFHRQERWCSTACSTEEVV